VKRDFTLKVYSRLLKALHNSGYHFVTFEEYMTTELPSDAKIVILRHDVDDRKLNSLEFARIQAVYGIKGTYYFRMIPASYSVPIIKQIKIFGHEVGYHYEDINFAVNELKHANRTEKPSIDMISDRALQLFNTHLSMLRELYPVKTISMHGSPVSKYDNMLLWHKHNYRDAGIIGEPYYDVDFNEMAYFTDTGRRWNGFDVSIRDKVDGRFNFNLRSTQQIIDNIDQLPDKIMFTFHPQRWTDRTIPWIQELLMQNVKNVVKALLVRMRWGEGEMER
jgi:hypothetical protein